MFFETHNMLNNINRLSDQLTKRGDSNKQNQRWKEKYYNRWQWNLEFCKGIT